MKKQLFLLLSVFAFLGLSAQDKIFNDANAEKRTISSFHAIRVSDGIMLTLKQGSEEAVAVSASEGKFRDRIKTEVVNGVLKIYYDVNLLKDLKNDNKQLKAYVSFKNLDRIDAAAGSKTKVESTISASDFQLNVSSGAKFEGTIEATSLNTNISSGGKCNLSGKADRLDVDASSGGHFYGYDLVINKCDANASSGGQIEIRVEKELTANAHSGGGVTYKGQGTAITISTHSGGRVKKIS